MKKFLFILLSWVVIDGLHAQNENSADMSALLENKIWKVQLPQDKQYTVEMEFHDAGWRSVLLQGGKRTETLCSYSLCEDTIKVFESGVKNIIQKLTDSTLVFQNLPDTLTIGNGPVRCVTDNMDTWRMKTAWTASGVRKSVGTWVFWICQENQSKIWRP